MPVLDNVVPFVVGDGKVDDGAVVTGVDEGGGWASV